MDVGLKTGLQVTRIAQVGLWLVKYLSEKKNNFRIDLAP